MVCEFYLNKAIKIKIELDEMWVMRPLERFDFEEIMFVASFSYL